MQQHRRFDKLSRPDVSQEDLSLAILYIAATQLMPKEVQSMPWEEAKPYFEQITPERITEELGEFTNPSQKLDHLLSTGGSAVVRMYAKRWREHILYQN